MFETYYVYALVNPFTHDYFYVGKGRKRRAWYHLERTSYKPSENRTKYDKIMMIRQQGGEPYVKILVPDIANEQEAYDKEKELIQFYGRKIDSIFGGILTNICEDNSPPSPLGRLVSDDTRRKIGDKQKGKLNHRFGKIWSEEQKEYRRQWNKERGIIPPSSLGRNHSVETKKKMASLGKKKSEDHCKAIGDSKRGKNHPNYGKHLSDETKAKSSNTQKERLVNSKNYRLVNVVTNKEYFFNSYQLKDFYSNNGINKDYLYKNMKRYPPYLKTWKLYKV